MRLEPTGDLWAGVGTAVGSAEGWMVVGALLVLGALFVVAKYIVPSRERIKMRELDIREREAQNSAALSENMRGLKESNDSIAREFASQAAGIEESKVRSRAMGEDMGHVRRTTDHTAEQVDEIHQYIFREGTD